MKRNKLAEAIRLALLFWMVVSLCAFGACGRAAKPDVPRGVIVQPKVVTVTRTEYVRVPAELTDPLPIAEGPLSLCPVVAADRKKQLLKANADRKASRALSGTEAKP